MTEPGGDSPSIEELREQLEATAAAAEETRGQLLRTQADLENLRKRTAREIENAHRFALENFLRELLPIKDALEAGLQSAIHAEVVDPEALGEGIELTLRTWETTLAAAGVEKIDALGEPFDPERHEAMAVRAAIDGERPGSVVDIVQTGYRLHNRLIRPARVIVAENDNSTK
jgi:molecular chaperone GrpE